MHSYTAQLRLLAEHLSLHISSLAVPVNFANKCCCAASLSKVHSWHGTEKSHSSRPAGGGFSRLRCAWPGAIAVLAVPFAVARVHGESARGFPFCQGSSESYQVTVVRAFILLASFSRYNTLPRYMNNFAFSISCLPDKGVGSQSFKISWSLL